MAIVDTQDIRDKIDLAQLLTRDRDEPFRSIAFWVVLDNLLKRGHDFATESQKVVDAEEKRTAEIPKNLNEFAATKQPKSHVERLLTIAYHSLHSGEETGINREEIFDGYARIRAGKPRNIHDVIAQCVKKGLLIESDSRKDGVKAWVVTPTGERYVENDFQM